MSIQSLYNLERVKEFTITAQPQSQTVALGSAVTLSVTVENPVTTLPETYQWQKDGVNLAGATSPSLLIQNVQPTNIGDYQVKITSGEDVLTSSVASLSIDGIDSGIWKGLVAYYPLNGNAND